MRLLLTKKSLLFKITLFLFIFISFNREFKPFGFDIRFLIIFFMLILCFIKIKNFQMIFRKIKLIEVSFISLYLIMAISNISYLFNDIIIDTVEITSLIILHVANFLAFITIFLYKEEISKDFVYKSIVISTFVLGLSILLIYFGFELTYLFPLEFKRIVTGAEHYNLFGQNMRIAGFAQDANFSTLFMMIGLFCMLVIKNKVFRFLFIALCLLGIALAWSRTIVIAVSALAIAWIFIKPIINYFENKKNNLNVIWLAVPVLLFLFFLVIPIETLDIELNTLSTRFSMWQHARELFNQSFIFGSGLGSFRFYFDQAGGWTIGSWIVQCHNTYWQVLSEMGIIGAVALIGVIYANLKIKSNKHRFLVLLVLIFGTMFEILYLQVFIVVFYILYLVFYNMKSGEENE